MGSAPLPKVLIIDDEPSVRGMLRRMLPAGEYEMTEAVDGQQALACLRAESFDVVLSDICMPGLSGVELLRQIREIDKDLPVILVTGNPDLVTATEAVALRAFRYMAKPPLREELRDAVQRAANLRRKST